MHGNNTAAPQRAQAKQRTWMMPCVASRLCPTPHAQAICPQSEHLLPPGPTHAMSAQIHLAPRQPPYRPAAHATSSGRSTTRSRRRCGSKIPRPPPRRTHAKKTQTPPLKSPARCPIPSGDERCRHRGRLWRRRRRGGGQMGLAARVWVSPGSPAPERHGSVLLDLSLGSFGFKHSTPHR
jgi:hypothetical protein